MALDIQAAIKAVQANPPCGSDFGIKQGSVPGVVIMTHYGKMFGSFRVIRDGVINRSGLRKINSVSAAHVRRTLEDAGFETEL